ncbi:hypothetical protein B9Z19DRAFT_1054124 [Tuber borchii]|uniref:Secreted protein n=1 Tax=Tuber borchii TaxID=42251 RepID=A0A2T6ZJ21_TUBBO|nr:hypothetical protein B9Z19DRAFT_1054124 [Tuber borchii]
MKYSVSALVLGFFAAPLPALSQLFIDGITYAGSGCKAGSVAVTLGFPKLTLAFDSYVASIGPGVPFVEKYKSCNLNVNIHYPPGYQYTLYMIDYTGFADLQGGVSASQTSRYWFAGFPPGVTFRTKFAGPYTNTYSFTDTLASESLVWSPCDASTTLNINTQLLLSSTNPGSFGLISNLDIQNSKQLIIYGMKLQKCT